MSSVHQNLIFIVLISLIFALASSTCPEGTYLRDNICRQNDCLQPSLAYKNCAQCSENDLFVCSQCKYGYKPDPNDPTNCIAYDCGSSKYYYKSEGCRAFDCLHPDVFYKHCAECAYDQDPFVCKTCQSGFTPKLWDITWCVAGSDVTKLCDAGRYYRDGACYLTDCLHPDIDYKHCAECDFSKDRFVCKTCKSGYVPKPYDITWCVASSFLSSNTSKKTSKLSKSKKFKK